MKTLTLITIATVATLFAQSLEVQLQRAQQKEVATGNVKAAIDEYKRIAGRAGKDRAIAAQALLRIAEAHQKLGNAEASKIYQQIVRDYSDQREAVATARVRLSAAGRAASGVVNRQVWTLPTGANPGRVSPDGRYIAYSSASDLIVRELATGTERSLAHFASGRPGLTLAWSPDGRRLAFEFADASTEIRSINVDGSGMRTALSNGQRWARVLDFFPDGNRVLCSRNQNGDSLVFWININDGSTQDLVLRPGPGGSGWPRLSPDGRYVALRNSPGLSLLATDGSGETVISRNRGDLNAAAWTPDGSRLLFVREQNGRVDLWAAPVANGKPNGSASLVYRDFGSASVIDNVVTRDGSLYYVKSSAGGFVQETEVYTASVDFAAGKLLTEPLSEYSRGTVGAGWSPDGKYLAYNPGSLPPIFVHNTETGQTRRVEPKLRIMGLGDWSLDNQKLVAWGEDFQGQNGIFSVDLQTGDGQLVVAKPADAVYDEAQYSPDGRKVYYRRRMRQLPTQVAYALMEHDLVTGQQRVLLDESARGRDLAGIRPSPDGRFLAYGTVDRAGSKDAFIHIRPVNEGQTREVRIPASEASLCHPMDWIKDSSAVIYHCDAPSETSGNGSKTWILPMADLKPRQLDLGFNEVMLSVHPDGKRIAFSASRPHPRELHVLENFLPAAK